MEQRLIDVNYLIKRLKRMKDQCRKDHEYLEFKRLNDCIEMLERVPTIDPVHASGACYCRECEHSFKSCPYGTTKLFCGHPDISTHEEDALFERSDNDFCSYGKKREEGKTE